MVAEGERGFEDLECYQLALQVLREAYRVARLLPPEERYNLSDQLRRSATSVVLNIAEGYGRYHYLDSLRFYYVARGSLEETLSGFIACKELGYTLDELPHQRELCHQALRSLNGYIRYVRRQQQGRREYTATASPFTSLLRHPLPSSLLPNQLRTTNCIYSAFLTPPPAAPRASLRRGPSPLPPPLS